MAVKTECKEDRVKKGNKKASQVMQYLNQRHNRCLVDFSGTSKDTRDGIDFGDDKGTYQCKVRDSGDDIIYESDKFYPTYSDNGFYYKREPGRDQRCKADFYVCKPVKDDLLVFPQTEQVKKVIKSVIEEWGVPTKQAVTFNGVECILVNVSDDQVKKWYELSRDTWNKAIKVFVSEKYKVADKAVTVYFKIDQGQSKNDKYFKLLFYLPYNLFDGEKMELIGDME